MQIMNLKDGLLICKIGGVFRTRKQQIYRFDRYWGEPERAPLLCG